MISGCVTATERLPYGPRNRELRQFLYRNLAQRIQRAFHHSQVLVDPDRYLDVAQLKLVPFLFRVDADDVGARPLRQRRDHVIFQTRPEARMHDCRLRDCLRSVSHAPCRTQRCQRVDQRAQVLAVPHRTA